MLITRADIQKAFENYPQEVKKRYGLIFRLFLETPAEINKLKEFATQTTSNDIETQTNFSEEQFLKLVKLLLEIEWHTHLTGFSDGLYSCINSYALLVKAMGNDGENKTEGLLILKKAGLANKKNIATVARVSFFSPEIPRQFEELHNKDRIKQDDVDRIIDTSNKPTS
ncbi:hypothetical protein [Legionella maioricensis]|uniref:Uncharacterized protein n=1 Tax=Legionella maioricensis TaxID=2896528 RepID=A0A9X2D159_9GAMM|nr:hypothetical protein [Legionella maioricensis]MCL9684566.1 hypothetical protein [Legionella maioricensis]MCL9687347.1 hypothetical protein [Legionella maioricensis]